MGAITLGILAGGRGARLGGSDKARLRFRGERLVDRTMRSFADPLDPVSPVLLSRGSEGVAAAPIDGFRTIADLRAGSLGPLAGLEALLAATQTEWLLTAPVDLRDVPGDLVQRLRSFSVEAGAATVPTAPLACVVRDGDGLQPLVALWPVASTLAAVREALDAGRLALHALLEALPHVELDIRPARLGNLNTATDFSSP